MNRNKENEGKRLRKYFLVFFVMERESPSRLVLMRELCFVGELRYFMVTSGVWQQTLLISLTELVNYMVHIS